MQILHLWPTGSKAKAGWLVGLLLFLCYLPNLSMGQDYCDPAQRSPTTVEGGFTVAKRVCVGTPVTVTNTKPTATAVKYIFGYTADSLLGTAGSAKATYTFPKKGIYKILQAGSLSGTSMIHCEEIEVLPLDPIKFTAKACIDRRATITIDDPSSLTYDTYKISWGDGLPEERSRAELLANPTHTYGNIGFPTMSIQVYGIYGKIEDPLCTSPSTPQTITLLLPASQLVIPALTTTSDNSIEIKYQTSAGLSIQLYQKTNGTYTPTGQKGSDAGTFTVQTDAKQVQCFQLVAQDVCSSSTPLKSDEVCSLVLDAKAGNKQNNLSWQPYAGTGKPFRYYRITRNNSPIGGTITNQSTGTATDDAGIDCGTQYCYSLQATIASAAQTIITSNTVCVTGINGDAPGDVGDVSVSIEDGHPRLIATPPTTIGVADSYTMIVSRASGPSGSFQPVATLDRKNTYTDDNANPSTGSYCYQVTYLNSCGLQSAPSKTVCTVFLQSKSTTGIDWNADSPFTPATVDNYILEVVDSQDGTKREIQVGSNTHYEPDPNDPNLQSQRYRIIALASDGSESYSNYFTFRRESIILVPDAFTPNNDGMNDVFLAKGIYVDQFTMNIYNRWGEVVYSTTDKAQGWDGNANGQIAPAGQYMYRIEVVDLTGQKTVRTGALLLVR